MCPSSSCQRTYYVPQSVVMAPTATLTVHELLRSWRGDMKLDRAAVYLSDVLGREISRETIRRYEVQSEAPKHLDPMLLAGLARIYGHDPSDLPPAVVDDLQRLASVIAISRRVPSHGGGDSAPPDLPNAPSRCTERVRQEAESLEEAA